MVTSTISGPPLAPYAEQTVAALFLAAVDRHRELPALGRATETTRLSYREVEARVAHVAAALTVLGVQAGDRVALLSENRPEWALVDYAALSIGAITVPIYPTLPARQVGEILVDCEPKVVFVSDAVQSGKLPVGTRPIVAFDAPADRDGPIAPFDALLDSTRAPTTDAVASWRAGARSVRAEDLATLIYTSGTTGAPKGVMLTHGNLAAMVAGTRQHGSIGVVPGEVSLSILPLSHVFERAAAYYFFAHGVTIVYAESMQTVARDVLAVRPHHLVAVPRLFEKVHHAVTGARGPKGMIARRAAATAVPYVAALTRGRRPSLARRLAHALADRVVYRVLRERMGGRLRTFICGGAPLDAQVGAIFHAAGMPIYEGYGLTETSPVISANKPGAIRLGSAGVPYPGVTVRLGAEQEIQVLGPGVMRGYWGQPEASAAAFTADGWFRTGDVGTIEQGVLLVIDRLKDLIVTAGGKNVAPQPLEQRVLASPYIAQAVLIGDRRPYLVMLLVPDEDAAPEGEPDALPSQLAAEVATHLQDVARVERPKRVALVREAFTVENGMLTPTLKVRRRLVARAYASLLDELYAGRVGIEVPWGEQPL